MQTRNQYDVAVVGAGPAGSLAAYYLAKNGVRVCIIEKTKLPRYKSCGGGITQRALRQLPFDIRRITQDCSTKASISLYGKPVFSQTYKETVVSMVMRDELDYFLTTQAANAGAAIYEQTKFLSLSGKLGHVNIVTTSGSFAAHAVIGADGVNSCVAKCMGLNKPNKRMMALECELVPSAPGQIESLRGSIHFDFGVVSSGYGWLFPKREHVSLGVLTTARRLPSIKTSLLLYAKNKGISPYEVIRTSGHLIPYGIRPSDRMSSDCGLLIGDAAGYCDPVTGEGLFYAFAQASIAADLISTSLSRMQDLDRLFYRKMRSELVAAERYAHLLYTIPSAGYLLLRYFGSVLGERHMKVMCGEKSYHVPKRKIASKLLRTLLPGCYSKT